MDWRHDDISHSTNVAGSSSMLSPLTALLTSSSKTKSSSRLQLRITVIIADWACHKVITSLFDDVLASTCNIQLAHQYKCTETTSDIIRLWSIHVRSYLRSFKDHKHETIFALKSMFPNKIPSVNMLNS